MYQFSVADLSRPGSVNNPPISTNDNEKPFTTVKPALQTYWRDRFQADADAYAQQPPPPNRVEAALRLRKYFAAIAVAVEKAGIAVGRQAIVPTP